MNVERLRALADHIEALPTRYYDQSRYLHHCGAPACIAGHAVALFGERLYPRRPSVFDALARDLLDLDDEQAGYLFTAFPRLGRDATTADAAKTLRHLADTGEVRWS